MRQTKQISLIVGLLILMAILLPAQSIMGLMAAKGSAGGGGGTITLITAAATPSVESAGNGATTGTADTTGANFIAACVSDFQSAATATVTDSNSNSYTCQTRQAHTGGAAVKICTTSSLTPTVGAGHTLTCTGSGSFCTIAYAAFTGIGSTTIDQGPVGSISGGTTTTSPSITPSTNGSLLIGCLGTGAANTGPYTVASPFTLDSNVVPGGVQFGIGIAHLIQATAGAQTVAFTVVTSNVDQAVQLGDWR